MKIYSHFFHLIENLHYLCRSMEKKETIPSYKRRLNDWDYSQPRIYMLTLAIEGRCPLLGTLVGDASLPTTASNGPRLLPSELGAAVLQEVDGIPHYYPQITIIARQLMPDHLHILLYVTRPLPVHLGQVVAGFKAGCNKKWRQMQGGAQRQDTQRGEAPWQNHWAPDQMPGQLPGGSAAASVPGGSAAAGSAPGSSAARSRGLLWEQGYHDRILSGEGQLQRLVDYIRENPRRSLIKRQHADWFRPFTITAAGTTLHAYGNLKLLPNGFSPYYKPQGHYFEACGEGRLLFLTPYPYSTQKVVLTRSVCNYLNVLAARLC